MSYDWITIKASDHDPYPLGVPERVRKQVEASHTPWDTESTDPVFHIEVDRMRDGDARGTPAHVDTFLSAHHVDEDLIDILLEHLGKIVLSDKRLKWIEVGWNYQLGWHIKIGRMVERKVGSGTANACGTAGS